MSKKWGYLNYKLLTIAHTLLRLHQNPIEIKQKNPQLHFKQLVTDLLSTLGGNRTHTLLPELDFESSASTSSATKA